MRKIILLFTLITLNYADISGTVFRDFSINGSELGEYGIYNSDREIPVANVKVTAYDIDDNEVGSTTTDENGEYSLDTNTEEYYRIEFSDWPSYLNESFNGDKESSSVRFAKDGDEVNFALHNPDNFTSVTNPKLITSVFFNGATSGDSGEKRSLISWNYDDTEQNSYDILAKKSDIGTVWGLAYDKKTQYIYAAAILKRHAGLLDSDNDGNGDIGVIYRISDSGGGSEEFYRFDDSEVGTIGNDNDRSLPETEDDPSTDAEAFDKATNIGLGDIELSPDMQTLYVVNIYNRKLYKIDTNTQNSESIDIPNDCVNSDDSRPFALNYNDGELYVGVTCSGYASESSDDLKAYVYKYNEQNSGFTKVIDIDLSNYQKGGAYIGTDGTKYGTKFNPWVHTWDDIELVKDTMKIEPQPLLTDIEFVYQNGKKFMIMSFLDRTGMQTGYANADTDDSNGAEDDYSGIMGGDVFIAVMNSDGTATIENDATVDSITTDGQGNEQGLGGGEFFFSEYFENSNGNIFHEEIIHGGSTYLAGSDNIPLTTFDPENANAESGGLRFFQFNDGDYTNTKLLYESEESGSQSKSAGLGDLELLTEPAPIEIGNRVWDDKDNDGIQDADEIGIADVNLTLSEGEDCSNVITSTVTDDNGSYIFSEGLKGNTTYSVCIDSNQFTDGVGVSGTPLESYILTKKDEQGSGKSDWSDSDADKDDDGNAIVVLTTGDAGDNNHTYDIGLTETYCLGDRIWLDENEDGIQNSDESNFTKSITIELLDENGNSVQDANGNDVEPITTDDGTYEFCTLLADSYKIKVTPPDGYSITLKDSGSDDTIDNDVNSTTKESDVINLQDDNLTIDIGLYENPTYCLGDFIWDDANKNGIQDSDESGISDVNITLNETGDKTQTDENGYYEFCGLDSGDYSITLDTDTLPDGYIITQKNAGGDDNNDSGDSDLNDDGTSDSVSIGSDDNTTLDGGAYRPTYCLGDFIWDDANKNGIQDSDESGISDVNITLNETGDKTQTDENGYYEFCGLDSGDYSITLDTDTLPDGYIITQKNAGGDDNNDSGDSDLNDDGTSDSVSIGSDDNTTLDGGAYRPTYCLGDFIWDDANKNGIQDSDESGISDVNITLNETGDKTQTDENGYYEFCGLDSGDYSITLDTDTLPDGYIITQKNAGGDDNNDSGDSDLNDDGTSDSVSIGSDDNTTLDGGAYRLTYCLGDFIWDDANKNGIQDSDESGISDVNITLNETGDKTQTDENGYYEFCGLDSGDYSITLDTDTLPDGYIITQKNAGGDDNNDSGDSDLNDDGTSDSVSIGSDDNTTLDGGAYRPTYCLGDFIWDDANKNGIQDSDESGISDVNITLNETGDKTQTDDNGYYEFCGLDSGDYSITLDTDTLPDGYIITQKNAGGDDNNDSGDSDLNDDGTSDSVSIGSDDNTTLDGGAYRPTYCLGDFIWDDANKNGIQDSDESGISDVNITLNETGDKTQTDENGYYEFCGLDSGDYSITLDTDTLPDGYIITQKNAGGDDNNDSGDSDLNDDGTSDSVSIGSDDNTTLDGGAYRPTYCLGDFIWDDANKNGIQDSDESGISDVNITLNETGDKTQTDDNGYYEFCGLDSGDYSITLDTDTLPDGYIITQKNAGGDDNNDSGDSDLNDDGTSDSVSIGSDDNTTLDGGAYRPTYCLGDFIWDDANKNGIQDSDESGISDVNITLNETGDKTQTDENGYYEFCGLDSGDYSITLDTDTLPDGYIITQKNAGGDDNNDSGDSDLNDDGTSDSVSIGSDDNTTLDGGAYRPTYCLGDFIWDDANKNGIQDSDESGISDVNITLNETGDKTQTDENGYYEFCGLDSGDYSITLDTDTLPDGYIITQKNAGGDDNNDSGDSDLNDDGTSDSVSIGSDDNTTLDGGAYRPTYCLGDFIWDDANKNGIQDSDESGIEDISITLYDENGNSLATDKTNSDGKYQFCNLDNGDYYIKVDAPEGYIISSKNQGSDDSSDSDIDPDSGKSDILSISGANNYTLDGGLYQEKYCLGDFIWLDSNKNGIQDSDESGIEDISITLYDENGNSLATDKTNSDGKYQFCNLDNGDYYIKVDAPEGYIISSKNQGSDDSSDSDIDPDSGKSDILSISGANNYTLDGGLYQEKYCLGDFIWLDSNKNGIQDSDESGISDVNITLNETGDKTQTDENGYYEFCGLDSGDYSITLDTDTLPDGYIITQKNAGGDDNNDSGDSDLNDDGTSDSVSIGSDDNTTLDGGAYRPTYCLGDFIWDDANKNGIQDSDESGIEDISITLYDENGNSLATDKTNSDGKYQFCNLDNGDYYIKVDAPEGYIISSKNQGSDDSSDSDIDPDSGKSDILSISGANNYTLDGGLYQEKYCLGDFIWLDSNKNGIQDSDESGIEDISITLYDENGNSLATDKTNSDGKYQFCNLDNGDYYIKVDAPEGYIISSKNQGSDDSSDSDIDPDSGKSDILSISGANNYTLDGGLYQEKYCLGDFIWLDSNKNGIQDSDESGIEDISITLYDENGNSLATDKTNSDGKYQFCNLDNGDYYIKVDAPEGYIISSKNQGSDDSSDSDIDPDSGKSDILSISGANNYTLDGGLYQEKYCLGDFIWLDSNKNGIQDSDESGIEDISITLYDENGNSLATDKTNSDGKYQFCNLDNGDYYIKVDAPEGYIISSKNQGSDDSSDSDIDPDSGKSDILSISGANNYTLDGGAYRPTYCLGNFIWDDANKNGIQDSDESGISDVNITLNETGDKTQTDDNGYYEFCGLDSGDYSITLDTDTLPDGYIITQKNAGGDDNNDSGDSDLNDDGTSDSVSIGSDDNTTLDGGLYQEKYCLGDFIWLDSNKNGIQDSDESGIEDISITLYDENGNSLATDKTNSDGKYQFCNLDNGDYYIKVDVPEGYIISSKNQGSDDSSDSDIDPDSGKSDILSISGANNYTLDGGLYQEKYCLGDFIWLDSNKNGIQDSDESGIEDISITLYDENGNSLATDKTNSDGKYQFCNLDNGDYYIKVDVPEGYIISSKNQGSDDSSDSDIDPDSGKSDILSISGANNYTLDGGLYQEKYCLGDFIWLDSNKNGIQDSDESGIEDISITLYDENGNSLATDKTNSDGKYQFCNLDNGDYYIKVDAPEGYIISSKNQGSDDSSDSDIDPDSGKSDILSISGANNYTLDGGAYRPTYCLGNFIWDDANKNGIQDSDESGISDVNITLNETGDKTQTDDNGYYEFCGLDSGDYSITLDTDTLPDGYIITQKNAGGDDNNDSGDSDLNDDGTSDSVSIGSDDNTTLDGGAYRPTYCLGNFIWDDANKNGIQDSDESGISDVNITLNETGDKTQTDDNGYYEFCGLDSGDYSITLDTDTLPDGYIITQKNAGGDDNNDSGDSDLNDDGTSDSVSIGSDDNTTLDGGAYRPTYCLGDFIWDDANKNGIQDSDESGIEDISITLYDENGNSLATDKTNSDGKYQFCNLDNGDYYIKVDAPEGYIISSKNQGSDDSSDSDIDPDSGKSDILSISGANNYTLDGGLYQEKYCLGDFIWLDSNKNGIQDSDESGIEDISITLYDENGNSLATDKTNSDGKYQFCNLDNGDYYIKVDVPEGYIISSKNQGSDDSSDSDIDPDSGKSDILSISGANNYTLDGGLYQEKYCLGDFIWLDSNKNGIQDSDESGIEDISITLYDENGNSLATDKTNSDGKYQFCNLDNGDYYIKVDVPEGYIISSKNQGSDDSSDSDIDPDSGKSDILSISGANNYTLDGGLYQEKYCLGDFIWLDSNKNGIQDSDESGIEDISITLYDENGNSLATDKTNSDGKYQFCNLDNGDYYIKVDAPEGYIISSKNQGSDDSSDSDIDPDSGKSDILSISGANNYTLDGGAYKRQELTPTIIISTPTPTPTISTLIPTPTLTPIPIPTIESEETPEPTIKTTPTPEPTTIVIQDDIVEVNQEEAITTINVLSNDSINQNAKIKLVRFRDGNTINYNDNIVSGTSIEMTDEIVVAGEGKWVVKNNKILFIPEEGFNGTPTPIYYIVQDENGNSSNIAKVVLEGECVCEPYNSDTSDSVPINNLLILLLIIFNPIFIISLKRKGGI